MSAADWHGRTPYYDPASSVQQIWLGCVYGSWAISMLVLVALVARRATRRLAAWWPLGAMAGFVGQVVSLLVITDGLANGQEVFGLQDSTPVDRTTGRESVPSDESSNRGFRSDGIAVDVRLTACRAVTIADLRMAPPPYPGRACRVPGGLTSVRTRFIVSVRHGAGICTVQARHALSAAITTGEPPASFRRVRDTLICR